VRHKVDLASLICRTAVVTIVLCNVLVVLCSRQLIGQADWVFVTLGPLRCDSLEAVGLKPVSATNWLPSVL